MYHVRFGSIATTPSTYVHFKRKQQQQHNLYDGWMDGRRDQLIVNRLRGVQVSYWLSDVQSGSNSNLASNECTYFVGQYRLTD